MGTTLQLTQQAYGMGPPPPILKVDLSAVIADSFWCINTADNSNRYVSHSIGIIEKVNLNQITHTLIT